MGGERDNPRAQKRLIYHYRGHLYRLRRRTDHVQVRTRPTRRQKKGMWQTTIGSYRK